LSAVRWLAGENRQLIGESTLVGRPRLYSLAGTSIAIFTFMLFFMYPRFVNGEINALLFQTTLVVMGVATFSFVFSCWDPIPTRSDAHTCELVDAQVIAMMAPATDRARPGLKKRGSPESSAPSRPGLTYTE
jgi:hypothetical protein